MGSSTTISGLGAKSRTATVADALSFGSYGALKVSAALALLLGSLFPSIAGIDITLVAAVFAVLGLAVDALRGLPRLRPGVVLAIALFAVLCIRPVFDPPVTDYGHDKWFRLGTLTLLTALSANLIRSKRGLVLFVNGWVAVSVILALVTISGLTPRVAGRPSAFGNNPIWLARALVTGLIMTIWIAQERRIPRWGGASIAALLGGAAFMTGSRGPLLAGVIGLLVILMYSRRARAVKVCGVLIAAVVAWQALALFPGVEGSRVVKFIADPASELSGSTRSSLISKSIPVLTSSPAGVGLGNWRYAVGEDVMYWPHNLYLEVAIEQGWMVLFVLVLLMAYVMMRLWRMSATSSACGLLLALLASEAFAVAVSGDMNARTFYFFLFLGAGFSVGLSKAAGFTDMQETPREGSALPKR